jgi:hypothetical protein
MNRALLYLLLFITISLQSNVDAQSRFNENWVFGHYAGLNFTSQAPSTFFGSAMAAIEGVASISDPVNGNLLYYSNGKRVWGWNQQLVGSGDNLLGDPDATQSVLFAPSPKNPRFIYVFTLDAGGGGDGLRYSVIDRNVGSYGTIKANSKNTLLAQSVTEKQVLLRHCDHQSYWLVAHEWGTNKFLSWNISSSGISAAPLETSTGPVYGGNAENAIGYMKATRNDDWLALAVTGQDRVDLFQFDNSTGQPVYAFSLNSLQDPYGIEFSHSGSKLYVSCLTGGIYQFDMTATDISATKKLVGCSTGLTGALQLANDGRIYISRDMDTHLGCIMYPEETGLYCQYFENAIYFLSGDFL